MNYAICTVAAAPVRADKNHRAEMCNQLLFGETVEVLESVEEWHRVRSAYDSYEGWITDHMIVPVEKELALSRHNHIASSIVNPVTLPDQLINIPMGAELTGFDEETRTLWDADYKYHGTYRSIKKAFDQEAMLKLVHVWMNAPYLWGGKTYMGVDCSGFVQTVFKVMGIQLKRDAWQQAEQGSIVNGIADSKEYDVAFFQNEKGRVTHVGIILNGERIVHASGKVRIDRLDGKGIFNSEKEKYTHQLHSIRRYF